MLRLGQLWLRTPKIADDSNVRLSKIHVRHKNLGCGRGGAANSADPFKPGIAVPLVRANLEFDAYYIKRIW